MTKVKLSRQTPNGQQSSPQPALEAKRTSKKVGPAAKSKVVAANGSGKIGKIISMMRRPKGASIADISKATDWQAHSVRGAISGAIKKKLGLKVTSEKTGTVRLYRIADKPAG